MKTALLTIAVIGIVILVIIIVGFLSDAFDKIPAWPFLTLAIVALVFIAYKNKK